MSPRTQYNMYDPIKIKVYFEHSIWNRLIEDVSHDEKKKKQRDEIQKIIKFRGERNKILIFASEAVIAELFPLKEVGKKDLRRRIQQIIRNKADGLLVTEYNELDSPKFARVDFMRLPTEEFIEVHRLFTSRGFAKDDAVHLATAFTKQMDIFLTVDEKTIWKKRDEISDLPLRIMLPHEFIKENLVT